MEMVDINSVEREIFSPDPGILQVKVNRLEHLLVHFKRKLLF